jgi:hypothetical protein
MKFYTLNEDYVKCENVGHKLYCTHCGKLIIDNIFKCNRCQHILCEKCMITKHTCGRIPEFYPNGYKYKKSTPPQPKPPVQSKKISTTNHIWLIVGLIIIASIISVIYMMENTNNKSINIDNHYVTPVITQSQPIYHITPDITKSITATPQPIKNINIPDKHAENDLTIGDYYLSNIKHFIGNSTTSYIFGKAVVTSGVIKNNGDLTKSICVDVGLYDKLNIRKRIGSNCIGYIFPGESLQFTVDNTITGFGDYTTTNNEAINWEYRIYIHEQVITKI